MPHIDRYKHEALIRTLREERKRKGITQEELSRRLGVHKVFVTKYESCDRKLDIFELIAICRELGIDIHEAIRAIEGDAPPEVRSQEAYMIGFSKGYLTAKGYEVVEKGVAGDEA